MKNKAKSLNVSEELPANRLPLFDKPKEVKDEQRGIKREYLKNREKS